MEGNLNKGSYTEVVEQLNDHIKRFNSLSAISDHINMEIKRRNYDIDSLHAALKSEFGEIRLNLSHVKRLITSAGHSKNKMASDFKTIAKQDSLNKLNKRVSGLNYEEFIHREELLSILDNNLDKK